MDSGVRSSPYVGKINKPWFDVTLYGAVGDASTDDSTAIQAAFDAAAAYGGTVYFPQPLGGSYVIATGITIPSGVYIVGSGKNTCIIKYTGTGSAFSANGSGNNTTGGRDFTIQLTGNNAIGIDAARMIRSTFTSIRVISTAGTGQIGISANITNVAWTSFYNVFIDITIDSVATGFYLDASVAQRANRWRIVSPTMLGGGTCFKFTNVQGVTVSDPVLDQYSVSGFTLGASCDRATLLGIMDETAAGGVLFTINAAANRTVIIGVNSYSASLGLGSPANLGIRGLFIANWDNGLQWTGSSVATAKGRIVQSDDVGIQIDGVEGISGDGVRTRNLRGTATIAAGNTSIAVTFTNAEADATYFVQATITGLTGTAVAQPLWITAKGTGGFTINIATANPAVSTMVIDWVLIG